MTLLPLDAEAIFSAAAQQTGLEKYIKDGMTERFKVFIAQFNECGNIESSALPAANEQLQKLVRNRLKLERDWTQHPEILRQSIENPFFVIGNPRSGTTVAQCLLTEDIGHRSPKYWESRHPSPPPGLDPQSDALAQDDENNYVADIIKNAPKILTIHPFMEQGGMAEAECEDLYATDFHIPHVLHFTKVPNVPQAVPPADPIAAFSFHKKLLQQFQWKTPAKRWVCKGPAHQYNISSLLEVYPDAQCFWMHRRPDEYLISMLEMLEIIYKPTNGYLYNVDPQRLIHGLRAGFDHILNQESINDPRVHHINFHHFIKDPVSSMQQCYEEAGIEFTEDYKHNITQWVANPKNRSDRYGKLKYDANKYGLSLEEVRQTFDDYCQKFGLYD